MVSEKELGRRIRARREELGWSIHETAKKAMLSCAHLSTCEYGKHSPTLYTINQIAEALGTTACELLRE